MVIAWALYCEPFVKGASMMKGYFKDPVATAATIEQDGWLRRGHVAYCARGKWYIVDRHKDLIRFHGWQIAPAEHEAVVFTHAQVVNAAVIGIPLEDGAGERAQAFVVLKPRSLGGSEAYHGSSAKYKALQGSTLVKDMQWTESGKYLVSLIQRRSAHERRMIMGGIGMIGLYE
ncbi:MAG: hypothetical protein Q9206_000542 [Seirophora lacunosa]